MNGMSYTSTDSASAGVYVILCKPTSKIYIGSTKNFKTRWNDHRNYLNAGQHHNPHFQLAWNKYGPAAFEFHVVEIVAPVRDLLIRAEQEWLDMFQPFGTCGFNLCTKAGTTLGTKWTEAHKLKMQAHLQQLRQSPRSPKQMAHILRNLERMNQNQSDEQKRKTSHHMTEYNKTHKYRHQFTDEQREACRQRSILMWKKRRGEL